MPRARTRATPRSTPRATPGSTPVKRAVPRATPVKEEVAPRAIIVPGADVEISGTPVPWKSSARGDEPVAPAATPAPTPAPRSRSVPDAPVVVHKSARSETQGYQPPPKRQSRGFFGFRGGPRYKFLTNDVRNAIDSARVRKGRWKYIIVHNSGTKQGNAAIFGNYHKNVRKMSNGLAYHFVIGNGNKSGNGEIEIGSRWTRQLQGGHVASDFLNKQAIGICLVGDYNSHQPTQEQIEALEELITYVQTRVGKIQGKKSIVKAHKDINPKPTDCPGKRFPYDWLYRSF